MTDTTNASENSLDRIFKCSTKAELKSECKTLRITRHDLFNAIMFAKQEETLLEHQSVFRTIHPMHLALTDKDLASFADAGVGSHTPATAKVARKIMATFQERRMLSLHLFWWRDNLEWWLLYFSQKDVSGYDPHWNQGPHVHLVTKLTHNAANPIDLLEEAQSAAKPNLPSGIHVRYDNGQDD
jgi:hypothetical protein